VRVEFGGFSNFKKIMDLGSVVTDGIIVVVVVGVIVGVIVETGFIVLVGVAVEV